MISNQKKKAVYKSALAVILGCAMTGCGSKNEGNVTDNNTDKTVETDQDKDNAVTLTCESKNAEVMSVEETNALTAGQIIKPEDCIKIPNEEALEARDLAFIYVYSYSENGTSEEYALTEPFEENTTSCKFERIEILKVDNYFLSFENKWEKIVPFQGAPVFAGNVISEEKIQELESIHKQKALK